MKQIDKITHSSESYRITDMDIQQSIKSLKTSVQKLNQKIS